ncbi:HepT-like ribonuclease domain-containing protein [Bradyrhizobium sp. BRP22]|nr:HepT-like ribonuclease domain-containing protein [Bradyrhizobium sp. BRP22]
MRHAYHRTDADLLWNVVERDLKPLKNFAEQIAKEAKP